MRKQKSWMKMLSTKSQFQNSFVSSPWMTRTSWKSNDSKDASDERLVPEREVLSITKRRSVNEVPLEKKRQFQEKERLTAVRRWDMESEFLKKAFISGTATESSFFFVIFSINNPSTSLSTSGQRLQDLEGWPCTRESISEFNGESRNFQHSLCLVSSVGI